MKKKVVYDSGGITIFFLKKKLLKMKLTFLCLLLSFAQLMASDVFSQSTRLTLNLKDARVEDVLIKIEEQSNLYFIYNREVVNVNRKVDVLCTDQKISDVLTNLFNGTNVSFEIQDLHIVLKSNSESSTQPASVSGKVTDSSGQPLPGVTVVVKGTTTGIITDLDGKYSLNNIPGDATLVFSFVGMRMQEIPLDGKSSINVKMEEDSIGIEEVVAVGYGKQKKSNVTGSVATVEGTQLTRVPVANISQALSGKLPGLIVDQNSGRPGSDGGNLYIRGFGANLGGVQGESPLVIVDGFERSFDELDPYEIESITILKDASAAVYGVRAATGVILVTTKKGIISKPVITYNGTYSLTENIRYPELANYQEYRKVLSQHANGAGWELTGLITPEREAALNNGEIEGTDWLDVATRDFAPQQTHNINVRGGSEAVKYFTSLGYLDQGSMWSSGDFGFRRYNGNINLDFKISNNLKSSVNLGWRRELRSETTAVGSTATVDLFNIAFSDPGLPSTLPDGRLPISNMTNPWSPLAATNKKIAGSDEDQRDILTGSIELQYSIPGIEGLSVKGATGYTDNIRYEKTLRKPYSLWAYNGTNYVNEQVANSGITSLTEYSYRFNRLTTQLSLNYNNTFGDHYLGGLLLLEDTKDDNHNEWVTGNDMISAETPYLFTANPDAITAGGNASEYGKRGLVGRLNYNYKEKYLFEFSFRNDASSYFPEATRNGFFPGVSAGWVLNKEAFLQDSKTISNLKLRASYSRLGNDAANGYAYIEGFDIYRGGNGYIFNGKYQTAIRTTGIPNSSITWQLSDLYNIGMDASFFNRKLGVELDVFYRKRSDLLAIDTGVTIPETTGANLSLANLESTDNRGFESVVNYRGSIKNLKFNISGNLTWAREKYLTQVEPEDYGDPDLERIERLSGNYINRTFGYLFDGFFTQEELDNLSIDYFSGQNGALKPGDIQLKDINGDNVIDSRDRKIIGKSDVPETVFGLNVQLEWKNFDFTMFWQGSAGFNQYFNGQERGMWVSSGGARNPYKYIVSRIWTEENQGVGAEFPVDMTGPTCNLVIDKYLLDSKYVRLKNLVVGYSLPNAILRNAGITKLRLYLSATNLITIDNLGFYPFDPELGGNLDYPAQRVFSFGLNISL